MTNEITDCILNQSDNDLDLHEIFVLLLVLLTFDILKQEEERT